MTPICAWCGARPNGDKPRKGEILSHTICEECAVKLKRGEFEHMNFPQPLPDPPTKTD